MLKAVETASGDQVEDAQMDRAESGPRSVVFGIARAIVQIVLMGAIIVGSYFAMNRLIDDKPERTARPRPEIVVPVEAATVQLGDQRPTIRTFGEVVVAKSIDIRSSVAGEVMSVNTQINAGRRVEAGDLLFEVDRFNYENAVAEAKANVAQTEASIAESNARLAAERAQLSFAQNQLDLAKQDKERARQLQANGTLNQKQVDDRSLIVSQREQAVDQRRNNIAIEEARLAQQQAVVARYRVGVARAERDLKNTVVRAPFSGVVRSTNVETGRIISTNDVALSLYDDKALDVRFTLTDAQYGRIAIDGDPLIGRTVDMTWNVGGTDYVYQGIITRIGADVAAERGGVDVFAKLKDTETNSVQLRPGAFVELKVPDRLYKNSARVPETAIFGTDLAYVIADGSLEARQIKLIAFDGEDAIIESGLNEGEMILATRLSEIDEGLKVRIADANGQSDEATTPQGEQGGRPSPELVAEAKKISGLSDEDWNALPREERRPFIRRAREASAQ